MKRPNQQQIRALALLNTPEFDPLLTLLRDSRAEVLEKLADPAVKEEHGPLQGEAKAIKDLLGLVKECDEVLRTQARQTLVR